MRHDCFAVNFLCHSCYPNAVINVNLAQFCWVWHSWHKWWQCHFCTRLHYPANFIFCIYCQKSLMRGLKWDVYLRKLSIGQYLLSGTSTCTLFGCQIGPFDDFCLLIVTFDNGMKTGIGMPLQLECAFGKFVNAPICSFAKLKCKAHWTLFWSV